ncbi:MAG: HAD family hydrolase [Halobacteriota archaeon]
MVVDDYDYDYDYDFWLFDLDGTLVDAEWAYTRDVFDRVGDRIGRPFSDREAEVVWHGLGGARNPVLESWGIDPDVFWPAFHAEEDPAERAAATYLHDDAASLLDRIDAPIGVVTHCQQYLADPVIDRLGLRETFETVLCCSEETGWKPDPKPIRTAIDRLDVPDTGTGVLAGDGESDIGAAWNAGLEGIHVERHGPDHRGRCVLGDYRISSFDELLDRRAAGD